MKDATFSSARLLKLYGRIGDAEDAIPRLRRFVLDLAVRGKLMVQDAEDEPACDYLRKLPDLPAKTLKILIPLEPSDCGGDLPAAWAWLPLGAIIDRMDAGWSPQCESHPRSHEDEWGVLKTTAVQALSFDAMQHKLLPTKLKPRPQFQAEVSDILVTRAGPKNRVGISCVVDVPCPKLMISDKLIRFHVLGELSARYIALSLNAGYSFEQIEAAKSGMAVMQMNISQNKLRAIPIPLPPLAEQHRIVAKVDELMALCDRLEQARAGREAVRDRLTTASLARLTAPDTDAEALPAEVGTGSASGNATNTSTFQSHARFALHSLPTLTTRPDQIKTLRQTILNLAVRGQLVEQDASDLPAAELLKRIAQEKARLVKAGEIRKSKANDPEMSEAPFELPRTWVWASLGTIFLYDAGDKRDPKTLDQSLWLLELEDLEKDTGRLVERITVDKRASQSTKSQFRVGDILYGKLRPYLNKVIVADQAGYSTTEIVAIRPHIPLCSEYCALALRRPDFVDYVTRLGQGTKMPRLRTEDAVVAPFPLPPLAEQHRIVAKVDELMALCDQLEASLTTTTTTRSKLLNALLHEALEPAADELEAAE